MSNINLLPWRTQQIFYKNNIFYAICSLVFIGIGLVAGITYIYLQILRSFINKDINTLEKEISIYRNKTKEIDGLRERKKLLLSKLEIINSLEAKRTNMVNILIGLARTTPTGIILKNVERKGNELIIKGISESNSRISLMMVNLENLEIFANPLLVEVKAYNENQVGNYGIAFTLQLNIKG